MTERLREQVPVIPLCQPIERFGVAHLIDWKGGSLTDMEFGPFSLSAR